MSSPSSMKRRFFSRSSSVPLIAIVTFLIVACSCCSASEAIVTPARNRSAGGASTSASTENSTILLQQSFKHVDRLIQFLHCSISLSLTECHEHCGNLAAVITDTIQGVSSKLRQARYFSREHIIDAVRGTARFVNFLLSKDGPEDDRGVCQRVSSNAVRGVRQQAADIIASARDTNRGHFDRARSRVGEALRQAADVIDPVLVHSDDCDVSSVNAAKDDTCTISFHVNSMIRQLMALKAWVAHLLRLSSEDPKQAGSLVIEDVWRTIDQAFAEFAHAARSSEAGVSETASLSSVVEAIRAYIASIITVA